MISFNQFVRNAYDLFDKINETRDILSIKEQRDTLEDFLISWEQAKYPHKLDETLCERYASNLGLCFSMENREEHCAANVLPDDCPKNRLTVPDGAIITDADLNALDAPFYKDFSENLDKQVDLLNRSINAGLLPLDIKTLDNFVSDLCLLSHPQSRVYLHQKAFDALLGYSEKVFTQEPILVDTLSGKEFISVREIENDDESDILGPTTMATNMSKYIIFKTSAKRLTPLS